MIVDTKFFGNIEIEDNKVIEFKEGIPGFEEHKGFVLLDIDEKTSLKCIQSIENRDVCLILINPWDYFKDYEIDLSDKEIKDLEIQSPEDVLVYNVITIRQNKITANLAAPVVINVLKMKGRQIILPNTNYEIRQEIKCL